MHEQGDHPAHQFQPAYFSCYYTQPEKAIAQIEEERRAYLLADVLHHLSLSSKVRTF